MGSLGRLGLGWSKPPIAAHRFVFSPGVGMRPHSRLKGAREPAPTGHMAGDFFRTLLRPGDRILNGGRNDAPITRIRKRDGPRPKCGVL